MNLSFHRSKSLYLLPVFSEFLAIVDLEFEFLEELAEFIRSDSCFPEEMGDEFLGIGQFFPD